MEEYEEVKDKLDSRFEVSGKVLGAAVLAVLVLVSGFAVSQGFFQVPELQDSNSTETSGEEQEVQRTKYQRVYVDCPAEYLDFCTKLSKIPTEEVSFNRVEDGKIYLDMEDGRTMVGRLPEGDSEGYLIRITGN